MLSAEQKEKIADYLERNWIRNNNGRLCKIVLNSNGKFEYIKYDKRQIDHLINSIKRRELTRKNTKVSSNEVVLCISETLGLQLLPYNTNDIVAQTRSYMSAPPAERPERTARDQGELDANRKYFGDEVDSLCVVQTGDGPTKKRRRRR